jgi:hypothetical protein
MKKFYIAYTVVEYQKKDYTVDCSSGWVYLEEDEIKNLMVEEILDSWEKLKKFAIEDIHSIHTYLNKTFFKKTEYVALRTDFWWSDGFIKIFEKDFTNDLIIKYKNYVEVRNLDGYSLKHIMEKTSADDFIEYLKDNGIATCPMLQK